MAPHWLPSVGAQRSEIERRALDRHELRRLLDAAVGSRLVIIDLRGRNGLRPAEARGLLWDDLDLDRRTLTVTGQLDRQNQRTAPKTKKADRTIQLDDATVTRLKLWSERQNELKIVARSAWQETGIVASTNQGTPIDGHSLARSLRLLCRRASIDRAVTPYELRHTAISRQADAGRSSWELAVWAGTSEAMINRVYRHRLRRVSAILPVDEMSGPSRMRPKMASKRLRWARSARQDGPRSH
jgi:integrase